MEKFWSKIKDDRVRKKIFLICILIFIISFGITSYRNIPDVPYTLHDDSKHYFAMAYNIKEYGIVSHLFKEGDQDLPIPTAYREPAYSGLVALAMLLDPRSNCLTEDDFILSGKDIIVPTNVFAYLNIFLLLLTSFLSLWIVYKTTNSVVLSTLALFVIGLSQTLWDYIDRCLTENLSVLLLLGFSISFYILIKYRNKSSYIISGLLLGILTLTRAIFQYAWLPLTGFIILHHYLRSVAPKKILLVTTLFLVSFFCVVTPWLVRNYINFDRVFITERGGVVLKCRSNLNMMNKREYFASFLFWTDTGLTDYLLKRFFDENDLILISRDSPDGYYLKARSLRSELIEKYGDTAKADAVLTSIALEEIKSHPFKHLLVCIPIAWKGFFIRRSITPFLFLGLFGFIFWSIKKRKWEYIAFIFLPIYLYGMHVLVTHNILRFNVPLIPILWISTIFTVKFWGPKFIIIVRNKFNFSDKKK